MSTKTPMFEQYDALKAQHSDALLFFRMGDFYELFYDDARVVSEQCELTLTARNKDSDGGPIPMAGVPHHAARGYIRDLVDKGFKIAIADQVEDPRQAKGLVRREVVRVVSPGVGLDPDDIVPREACWLVSVCAAAGEGPWGLALLDVSTGDLRVTETPLKQGILDELERARAREAVLPTSLIEDAELAEALRGLTVNPREDLLFDVDAARRSLARRFDRPDLAEFGCQEHGPSLAAAEALLTYAQQNARTELPHLTRLRPYGVTGFMVLDSATRRNLELERPIRGTGRKGTLLHLLDRTGTAMGGRMLREWMAYPLLDLDRICQRHDAVGCLVEDGLKRRDIREHLKAVSDIERLAGKLAQRTANARDLVRLRGSIEALPAVLASLAELPPLVHLIPEDLCEDVAAQVATWLVDEPPTAITEGGLIRAGVDAELDELISLSRDGKAHIAAMEAREREATEISSLKIKYNKVFGYFLEISRANLHRVPEHYLRKQTLSNAERFITPELKEFEEKVLGADERRKALEAERFVELREALQPAVPRLQVLSRLVAELDVYAALAEVAADNRYVRPEMDLSCALTLTAARHPVVEQQDLGERFVPNDVTLLPQGRRLLIVTGPNMSGKSTVLRQTALLVLMAQMGGFVAADAARVGVCDRIFTRVGASDDLASGQSTFMVEMSETANILHNATERSLVLLDEIGRGTSTYDGLAIAWAVAEALHDRIRARGMFATHYHELVQLADSRPNVANVSVSVSEWGEKIIFLRRLKEGGASRSYGIQCARLAGMPRLVVERAKTLLVELEKHAAVHPTPQLSLFGYQAPAPAPPPVDPIREALAEVDPDTMSPREALDALYRLRDLARG
ncbi:MAG: DNA mismatch repair protein MutS [Alphaproteobacteria bacterium]|nr:DNA mismatch repair protein MutS [Alphaproteobacteria bacterium]